MTKLIKKNNLEDQDYSIEKLSKSLDEIFKAHPKLHKDDLLKAFESVRLSKKQLNSSEIYDLLINQSLKMCNTDNDMVNLEWRFIASKLTIKKLYKDVAKLRGYNKLQKYSDYYAFVKQATEDGLYDSKLLNSYTEEEFNEMAKELNLDYDLGYDYAGLNSLMKRYLIKKKGKSFELPQEMYMSVCLLLASPEKPEDRMRIAKKFYHAVGSRKISLATPILLNLRKPNGNLASCFVGAMDDSLNSIYYSLDQLAQISKNAGGCGINISRVRGSGSYIRGVKGASSGVMPWVKLINDTGTAVNQQGARAGAITVALDIWHIDIEDFLHCQTENGDLRKKAFDIFPQIVIPDLFMERVEQNGDWHLVDPNEVKLKFGIDLAVLHGEEFREKYIFLENQDLDFKKKISAKELFKTFLKTVVETGMPYVTFKDTINATNPNKHAGMIGNANLCVAPETLLLTDKGEIPIIELDGQEVNVWNGKEWSLSTVFKTGENQSLMKINIESWNYDSRKYKMHTLYCTEYHKFYDEKGNEIRAKDLKPKETILEYSYRENGDGYSYRIDSVEFNARIDDTYCFNEPILHKGFLNGVRTGNCTESFSNFKPSIVEGKKLGIDGSITQKLISGELHVCSLVSQNLAIIEDDEIDELTGLCVRLIDNVIDLTDSPVVEAELHNNLYRIIGIGSMGLHDYLVKNKTVYRNAQALVSKLFERIAYAGLKASMELAKERGSYKMFEGSEFSKGIVFGKDEEWFKTNETSICTDKWVELLNEIKTYGIRNGSLFAIAPNTSTSLLMGCTASILPTFSKFFLDKASNGSVPIAPPFLSKDTFWYYQENKNMNQQEIINIVSEIQKWTDQGISMELYLNLNNGLRAKDVYDLYMSAWKKKCKTVYYVRSIALKTSKEECVSCAN